MAAAPSRRDIFGPGDTYTAFGQYLSGMARMAKATGDRPLLEKAANLVESCPGHGLPRI